MSDAAITTIVTGVVTIVTMIIGLLTLWVKQRSTETKVDENTQITRKGTADAAVAASRAQDSARAAAETAKVVENKTDGIAEKLNGKLEVKVREIVQEYTDPLMQKLMEHSQQDDTNMLEIRKVLGELRDGIK